MGSEFAYPASFSPGYMLNHVHAPPMWYAHFDTHHLQLCWVLIMFKCKMPGKVVFWKSLTDIG